MVEDANPSGSSRPPKAIVRDGWNRISRVYRADDADRDFFGHPDTVHQAWLRPLFKGLPPGTKVLDLGCGCGVPDCDLLADQFDVTGVDISDVQIERARQLVPSTLFVRADMTDLDFPRGTFGAVVCLYALIHVPLEEQRELLMTLVE